MRLPSPIPLILLTLLFALLAPPSHAADPAANPVEASTSLGKVTGKLSADGQVRAFLGIPYAAPPTGQLRWVPPQPARKWHGTRAATSFGPHCYQQGGYPDMIFRDPGQSEDCLTLNIWTPANAGPGKLPVMVWIYGGGFVTGGTSEARQDGEHLAHKGVVVVTMNYRLGIFGFFAHHELAAESLQHASGNYGLMDQTAALRWVKQNIARFGGDPGNVTIFGESAGSFAVSVQMASPMAKGLFVHAIGESGGAFSRTVLQFPTLPISEQQDEAFAQTAFGFSGLASLRALPPEELVKAAIAHTGTPHFGPNVDGAFLPESAPTIYAHGKQAHVPLLAGWNHDEGTLDIVNALEKPTDATLRSTAEEDFGPQAEDFLKVYAPSESEDVLRVAEDYSGDRFIAYSTWAWLEAQVATGGAPVYRYRFDLGSPGDPNHPASAGAFHSDEIEYVFGNLDSRKGAAWRPEDYRLSELMQTYWTNFARTGNPNSFIGAPPAASPASAVAAAVPGVAAATVPGSPAPGTLPNWPQYNAADQWQVMHLDATPHAEPDRHRDRYLFLQQAWSKPTKP